MDTRTMTDALRAQKLGALEQMAPQSLLIKVPSIAASYAAIVVKGGTLATSVASAATLEKQYKAALAVLELDRSAFDLEYDTLGTAVGNNAASAADVTGMSFTVLDVVRSSKTVPSAPAALDVKLGQVHGKARVAVAGKGYLGTFAAQAAFDPLGATPAWFVLPGSGKQRSLAYPTGTRVWVQFAQVRYGLQGPWSVAVLVTMP
jgi:hypothetical protein